MVGLLGADEPAWAEVVIVLDDEAHFEVVLGIRTNWVYPLVSCLDLLLYLKQLLEVFSTLTGFK